jgi:hypothetical protein
MARIPSLTLQALCRHCWLEVSQVFSPMVGNGFYSFLAGHEFAIGALEAWTVQVGRVGDGSMETGVSLAGLDDEFVERLALVEDATYLVDGVPVRRDSEDRAANSNRLDAPGGGLMKVDEVHEDIPGLPLVNSRATGPARPVEVRKSPVHYVVQAGQGGVRGGHGPYRKNP